MKKTVGYLRISKDEENSDNQLYQIRKYCEENNLDLVEIYTDTISGSEDTETREGWKKLMSKCNFDKTIDTIVFYDISRMSRSVEDGLNTLKKLSEEGYTTLFSGQTFLEDIKDPMLKKKVIMDFLWYSELYIEDIKKRIKASYYRKMKDGESWGRPRTFIDWKKVRKYREKGLSWSAISRIMDISYPTLLRRKNEEYEEEISQ